HERRWQLPAVQLTYGMECRLRRAVACDEAERPIADRRTAGEPLVGPREDERARHAPLEGRADLPRENGRLPVRAFADRIDAELGEHQRLVLGEILQPREVAAKRTLLVQIDVEADEIDAVDVEVLRRREVRVADQRVAINRAN